MRYIVILFIAICNISYGQGVIGSSPLSFSYGGGADESCNAEIIDTDIVDYKLNFCDWPLSSVVTESMLETYIEEGTTTLGVNDTINYTSTIEDFDGSRAQKSIYYANECCYKTCGSDSGSGLYFLYDQYGDWNYDTIYMAYNVYLDSASSAWDYPGGIKLPGIRNYQADGRYALLRLAITSYLNDRSPAFYSMAINAAGWPDAVVTNSKDYALPVNKWINFCLMARMGSVGYDGQIKMFIDGVLISTQSLRWLDTGRTLGVNQLKYETNAGGCTLTNGGDHDQYMYITDLVIGKPGAMWDSTYIRQSLPVDANFGR